MFAIGVFSGPGNRKEVAIVHKKWIKGNKCMWPPFWRNTYQLANAVKNGLAPDPSTWLLYEVNIDGGRYFRKLQNTFLKCYYY